MLRVGGGHGACRTACFVGEDENIEVTELGCFAAPIGAGCVDGREIAEQRSDGRDSLLYRLEPLIRRVSSLFEERFSG
jgi:hypothetical protein